jgi:hypothetical protein
MLLFAEASEDQLKQATACLKLFCDASGQKVSGKKLRFAFP